MKPLFLMGGLICGAIGGYWYGQTQRAPQSQLELTAANETIAKLQADLNVAKESVGRLEQEKKSNIATAPAESGTTDINKLFNDAKPLLKQVTAAFEPQQKEMRKRLIEDQLKRMMGRVQLTPEQQAAFQTYLEQLGSQEQQRWQSVLDGNGRLDQMMTMGRNNNPQKAVDEWAQQNLTGEQATAYQQSRLTEKAQQITDSANRRVEGLTSSLNLDQTQQDQVFDIMVKSDKNYDPSMQLEGVANPSVQASSGDLSRDDAIMAVLNPEQKQKYESQQKERKQRSGGFWKALGLPGRAPDEE
jgi:hypothetical protein